MCYEDQNMEDAKAWISREEEIISGAEGGEDSALSCPLLLVMGVEERAAFTIDRMNVLGKSQVSMSQRKMLSKVK